MIVSLAETSSKLFPMASSKATKSSNALAALSNLKYIVNISS
jgi:hypothetical protein